MCWYERGGVKICIDEETIMIHPCEPHAFIPWQIPEVTHIPDIINANDTILVITQSENEYTESEYLLIFDLLKPNTLLARIEIDDYILDDLACINVPDNETTVYFADKDVVRKWTSEQGCQVVLHTNQVILSIQYCAGRLLIRHEHNSTVYGDDGATLLYTLNNILTISPHACIFVNERGRLCIGNEKVTQVWVGPHMWPRANVLYTGHTILMGCPQTKIIKAITPGYLAQRTEGVFTNLPASSWFLVVHRPEEVVLWNVLTGAEWARLPLRPFTSEEYLDSWVCAGVLHVIDAQGEHHSIDALRPILCLIHVLTRHIHLPLEIIRMIAKIHIGIK